LAYFKYANFFLASFQKIAGSIGFQIDSVTLYVILPVGISFYTFQTLSYVFDVHRGVLEPTKKFVDFSVYVSFFPQLVAGPIERAKHFLPQVQSKRIITWKDIRIGLWLILIGYFKKAVVADNCAVFANDLFKAPQDADAIKVILGTYAFAFQIYGDFSGYSDIARGLSRCFGFDLMLNFRRPYFAKNPQEFWSRWHISLSTWFRDYLYIPLGGNRKGKARTSFNLMTTMVLGGLWHGASYNFIMWGGYHGSLLLIYRWLAEKYPKPFRANSQIYNCMKILLFFHFVCIGWVLFRINSVADLLHLGQRLLIWDSTSFPYIIPFCFFVFPLVLLDMWFEKHDGMKTIFVTHPFARYLLLFVLIYFLLVSGNWKGDEFIYFQF
jgi:alginate O-acetyltransferase complex protein AlgI